MPKIIKYESLEHMADLKIRAFGKTLGEVFANMALGMFNTIIEPQAINKDEQAVHEFEVEALDLSALLVDFLSKLLSLSDIENEIYNRIVVSIRQLNSGTWWLEGQAYGFRVRGFKTEIKAVTYNELKLEEEQKGNWVAEVVFDL